VVVEPGGGVGAAARGPAGFSGVVGVMGADAFFEDVGTSGSGKAGFVAAAGAVDPGGARRDVGGFDAGAAGAREEGPRSGTVGRAGPAGFGGAGAFASAGAGGSLSAFSAASAASAEVMGMRSDVPDVADGAAGAGVFGAGVSRGCSGGVARRLAPSRCEADAGRALVTGGAARRSASDLDNGSGGEVVTGVALAGRAGMVGPGVICAVGASPERRSRSVAAGRSGAAGERAGPEKIGAEAFFAGGAAGVVDGLTASGPGNAPVAGLAPADAGDTGTGADLRVGGCAAGGWSGAGVRRSDAVAGRRVPVDGFAGVGAAAAGAAKGCLGATAGGA